MSDMFSKDNEPEPQDFTPSRPSLSELQVSVVVDGSTTRIDFEAGKTVGFYLGKAGVRVGLLSGNKASVNGRPVKKGDSVTDPSVIINVTRAVRNGR